MAGPREASSGADVVYRDRPRARDRTGLRRPAPNAPTLVVVLAYGYLSPSTVVAGAVLYRADPPARLRPVCAGARRLR